MILFTKWALRHTHIQPTLQWEDCQAQSDSIRNFDFDGTEYLYTFQDAHTKCRKDCGRGEQRENPDAIAIRVGGGTGRNNQSDQKKNSQPSHLFYYTTTIFRNETELQIFPLFKICSLSLSICLEPIQDSKIIFTHI